MSDRRPLTRYDSHSNYYGPAARRIINSRTTRLNPDGRTRSWWRGPVYERKVAAIEKLQQQMVAKFREIGLPDDVIYERTNKLYALANARLDTFWGGHPRNILFEDALAEAEAMIIDELIQYVPEETGGGGAAAAAAAPPPPPRPPSDVNEDEDLNQLFTLATEAVEEEAEQSSSSSAAAASNNNNNNNSSSGSNRRSRVIAQNNNNRTIQQQHEQVSISDLNSLNNNSLGLPAVAALALAPFLGWFTGGNTK
jgi:hypothetical protein